MLSFFTITNRSAGLTVTFSASGPSKKKTIRCGQAKKKGWIYEVDGYFDPPVTVSWSEHPEQDLKAGRTERG